MEQKENIDGFENYILDSFQESQPDYDDLKEKLKLQIYKKIVTPKKSFIPIYRPLLFGAFSFLIIFSIFLLTNPKFTNRNNPPNSLDQSIEEIDLILAQIDQDTKFLDSIDSDLDSIENSYSK